MVALVRLMCSSQAAEPHQWAMTNLPPPFSAVTGFISAVNSSRLFITRVFSSSRLRAVASISSWMVSMRPATTSPTSAKGTVCLSPLSRRLSITWPSARSRGPSSSRTGTPRCSQWKNLAPGFISSRWSSSTASPFSRMAAVSSSALA